MDESVKTRVSEAMAELKIQPCPRCGSNQFGVFNSYFRRGVQEDVRNTLIGGPSIPTVIAVCNRCGYLSEHAVGILCPELLEDDSDSSKVHAVEEESK